MISAEALRDEDRRLRRVRLIVSLTTSVIAQGGVSRAEAEALVAAARARILALFPGREETFDLLYGRRFARLIDEFAAPEEPSGRLLEFPGPPTPGV